MASKRRNRQSSVSPRPKQPQAVLTQSHTTQVAYSGPTPPPEVFEHLQRISPDLADRVMALAEKEQSREIAEQKEILRQQSNALDYEHKENMVALMCAFGACVLFLGTGSYLILEGHTISGGLFAGTSIVGIVASFLKNIGKRKQEENKK